LARGLTRHSGSLQKNRLIALEGAAAADAEDEFTDGSSSPANAIIVGVGVGPDASARRTVAPPLIARGNIARDEQQGDAEAG